MIFNFVEIKNFKSYGDYETRIQLNTTSSRLLLGENGAGKTTFVDAIIWALYGKSLSNVDEIINRKTKVDCKVEVNFDVRGCNYSVIRYRNHNVHKNSVLIFRDKENISPRTANEAQTLILDIIEISYNAMVSGVLFSSELYISFLRSKPSDRLKILENILSLKEIQLYHDAIKEIRKPIRKELEESILEKNKCLHEIEFTNNIIADYKEKVKNKLLELKQKRTELENEAERLKNDLETIGHINIDEELSKNERVEEIRKNNEEIIKKKNAQVSLLKDIDFLTNNLSKIKNELDELLEINVEEERKKNVEHERIKQNNLRIKSEVELIATSIIDVDKIKNLIDRTNNELKIVQLAITNLTENSEKCPTCGQKVKKELTDKLLLVEQEKRDNLLDTLKNENLNKENSLKKNDEALLRINNANSKIEKEIEPSKYNEEYLKNLSNKIAQRQSDIRLKEQEILLAEETNKRIKESIKEVMAQFVDDKNLESSAYTIDYLKNIKENSDNFKNRISEIEDEIKIINASATSTYDKTYVEKMNSKISKIVELLEKFDKRISDITIEDNHYDILQQLFSNKSIGVKKYIIDSMLHVFNEKVNFYLPFFFSSEISILFSKDLEEEIKIGNTKVSFSTFSSGEKTRLELAIAFSLFMVVKTFFSSSVNLLVFDEILDMNLDSNGVESVLNIISNIEEDNCIIVISHREEYKESFPNQILLKKDAEGFSRILTR